MTDSSAARSAAQAFADGCEHVETLDELTQRLARGKPLRVKLGLDPTSADLHVGHAVVLRKLQQFVDAGHDVTLLIGDFTARIGDPTGRNAMRPPLTDEAIAANMQTYAAQAGKVLDMQRVTLRYNSEWLGGLGFSEVMLLAQTTVAQMLDRKDSPRATRPAPDPLHEFLSGGKRTTGRPRRREPEGLTSFNLLVSVQQHAGQEPQVCLTVPRSARRRPQEDVEVGRQPHRMIDAPNDQFCSTAHPGRELGRYARRRRSAAAEVTRLEAACAMTHRETRKAYAEAVAALVMTDAARRGRLLRAHDPAASPATRSGRRMGQQCRGCPDRGRPPESAAAVQRSARRG